MDWYSPVKINLLHGRASSSFTDAVATLLQESTQEKSETELAFKWILSSD